MVSSRVIANKVTTVIFYVWAVFMLAGTSLNMKAYLGGCALAVVLFVISVIVGHICLKDYKEENYTEESDDDR